LYQLNRFDVDNMMASWNHIFTPTSVLEVKFGRNVPTIPSPTINTKIERQEFLTKAGLTMFQPDVLFNPIPDFEADGGFGAGSGRHHGDRISVHRNFRVQGRHSLRKGAN
jgi:hypothetical protein